ncbi:hypothetical protein BCV72DRAFT_118558 [Rhizopus microsporus var. microsporus]|nr:hypothetical protein BCV72DRAFT_118558 [Rhizopus microsporus var. microsporus]
MGYKQNPFKCVILDSSTDPITCILYDQPLPRRSYFCMSRCSLQTEWAARSRGFNSTQYPQGSCNDENPVICWRGSFRFLQASLTRFYKYGLAINCFAVSQLHALEEVQNNCIKKIYGTQGKASTKVMLHMSKLFPMSERVSILQAQLLFGVFDETAIIITRV